MTYGELIIYVIQNGLVDEQVFHNGKLAGFMSMSEAAVKFNTGTATIAAWMKEGMIDYINFQGVIFIPQNAVNPMERKTDEKTTTNTQCNSTNDTVAMFKRSAQTGAINCSVGRCGNS